MPFARTAVRKSSAALRRSASDPNSDWRWAVSHLAYISVLAFCLAGASWLEVVLRTRVFRRWRRLVLTLLPVVALFAAWDVYAIAKGHWNFDASRTTGLHLPGRLPIEELLFFIVIPVCAVLSFEAVRAVRGWPAGDEAAKP
jgi:lycopene cyclase domain-containing protein